MRTLAGELLSAGGEDWQIERSICCNGALLSMGRGAVIDGPVPEDFSAPDGFQSPGHGETRRPLTGL